MFSLTATKNNILLSRLFLLCLVPGLFALLLAFHAQADGSQLSFPVVIKLADGVSALALSSESSLSEVKKLYNFETDSEITRVYTANFKGSNKDFEILENNPKFEYVTADMSLATEAIYLSDPTFTMDDKAQEKLWWLSRVKAPQAWEIQRGSRDVIVAVIDTGVNGIHEDLNDGRVGAGYVSYCQIPDPTNGTCLVHVASVIPAGVNSDDNGHGTIVAGIIGAIPNNEKGVAGVNWNVRILPVKVLDNTGTGVASDVAAGITWAVDQGASIINMSLGGTSLEGTPLLNEAIKYAYDKKVLIVAAAGNDSALIGADLDIKPVYPVCSDGGENRILGVTAVDINDRKASFANYGRACIDVNAPGTAYFNSKEDQKGILSTYYDPKQPTKNNVYVFASGTSMSTPIVTGAAALLKAQHPDLAGTALRDRLIASIDNVDDLNEGACNGIDCAGRLGLGRINIEKALQTVTVNTDNILQDPSGNKYLVENGVRRLASDYVLKTRGLTDKQVKIMSVVELETIPLGQPLPPIDGSLVKAEGDQTIYLVTEGVLKPASYLAFRSFNFEFQNVTTLSPQEIASYRKGPNLIPNNGALLKLSNSPAVYFLHEGKRRLISYFSFVNRGYDFSQVIAIENEELDRYLQDTSTRLQPPLDGTLIRGDVNPEVYVIEDGHRRALSLEAFTARNYQFSSVNILPQSEVDKYHLGIAIK